MNDLTNIANEIFLAYDIRGIYGKTINPEIAERIGGAVAQYAPFKSICIGYDGRDSSQILLESFMNGMKKYGANVEVTNIGMVPTAVTYYTTWKEGYDFGVSITASHNPPQFNGFKFALRSGLSFGDLQGLKSKFLSLKNTEQGKVVVKQDDSAIAKYNNFITNKFSNVSLFGKKIATETYHGVMGILFPWFFVNIGAETLSLNPEVMGDFNGLEPEPKPETIVPLSNLIKEKNYDFGIAFDGDGDRCAFIDDKGKMLSNAKASVLFVHQLLEKYPGSKVMANVECSSLIKHEVEKKGGEIIWSPVGHTIMEEIMYKEHVMLAAEPSHHYFFADIFPFSDGLVGALKMCQIILEKGKLSDIVDKIPSYPMRRIGFSFASHSEKDEKMNKLKSFLQKDYECSLIDGIKIFLNESDWVLIRKSNTEPKIRMTAEAKTENDLEKILTEFSDIFKSV